MNIMANKEFKTIKYFKASQLEGVAKSSEAHAVISISDAGDNMAVLLTITNPLQIEKAVNITKGGFSQIKQLIPA